MEVRNYLKDELKRLNRINDLLEKRINTQNYLSVVEHELISKNALTMCEIAKALKT